MAFSAPLGCMYCVSGCLSSPKTNEISRSTYAKLNGGGEEVNTGRLGDLLATGDTGQVDVGRLNDALLALGGLDHSLGETARG